MDPFKDRVAVITGGAGGIGMAMARAFSTRGARIILADLDNEALGRATGELREAGVQVLGVRADVTKPESVERLADASFDHFGAVHIVCNNAGVAPFGLMYEASHKDWEFAMNVNVWGVIHGVQTFVPRILKQGQGGHIVNTASMAGLVGMEWLGLYCATKFAVVGLSESLYRELKPQGVGVSVLCPMIVDTNINQNTIRMRPREMRNPGKEDEQFVAPPAGSMKGGVIKPEEVGRRVARAIERKDLYILTHPEQREFLRRRAARLDAMFEEDKW